jgi:hypothetical protein
MQKMKMVKLHGSVKKLVIASVNFGPFVPDNFPVTSPKLEHPTGCGDPHATTAKYVTLTETAFQCQTYSLYDIGAQPGSDISVQTMNPVCCPDVTSNQVLSLRTRSQLCAISALQEPVLRSA